MKRIGIMLSVVCVLVLFMGFDFTSRKAKKACKGYEVIEAGKGIDCNGDTIRLTKRYGYFEVAEPQ
jgi:hypothetical protein